MSQSTLTGVVFCKTPELFSTATAVIGDVNSDGLNDAVILYGIEGFDGGNNYARFCSLFLNTSQSLEYSSTFNPHENLEYREYVELLSIEDGVLIGKKFVSEDLVDITELGKVKWVFEDGKMVRL
ncbi:MAG: hypothetical protein IPH84_04140 [Bacteroidales bacterium]|nr:hypothetical protein [Bacteroidales bacterium]